MKRIVCKQLRHLLLRIAIALILAVAIFVTPISVIFPSGFLLISAFLLAESKLTFTRLHLTTFKLE